MGIETSVRSANSAHSRSCGQPSGAYRVMIELEGGYLREASRQGAHRRRCGQPTAPTVHSEACHRGAHSVVSQRHPQDIVRPAIVALTVRSDIGAHKNISESCHTTLTARRPSRRSQNISVACHCGAHSEACHRALTIYHKIK